MSKASAILGAVLATFCFGCRSSQPTQAAPRQSTGGFAAADQTNASLLPDRTMTPGATLPVTKDDICVPGYTQKVRNVPADVKRQVYAEYGIASHRPGQYEVDHLISLELGGSNSIKNLWPQSYLTQPWNAHVKDQLENEMHSQVCSGRLDLATAQHDIETDWIAAYKKYFNTSAPLSKGGGYDNGVYVGGHKSGRSGRRRHPLTGGFSQFPAPPVQAPAADMPATDTPTVGGQVWVNLKSGKYFRPGSSYYGHTKQGQYMSESDAQAQGYIAARGQ